jgi:hypothetical protein
MQRNRIEDDAESWGASSTKVIVHAVSDLDPPSTSRRRRFQSPSSQPAFASHSCVRSIDGLSDI